MNPYIVSSLLREGFVINTRLVPNIAWYRNIVYKSQENTVLLCLLDTYLENMVMKGSKIILKHANEFFEYLFEGIVTDIRPEYPAHVIVSVQRAEELVNTRAFPRYDTYLPSNIKPLWSETEYFCIVTNICLGGIAFISKNEFDYGDESGLCIFLPGQKIITGKGKVIRKNLRNDIFEYSMQFIDMTEEDSTLLSDYMALLDQNTTALQTYFHDNIKGLL